MEASIRRANLAKLNLTDSDNISYSLHFLYNGEKNDKKNDEKKFFLDEVLKSQSKLQNKKCYELAFNRRKEFLEGTHTLVDFKTFEYSRLSVGFGTSSPIETGLTLLPLFGVPMIPGSAIKGLCRNYVEVNELFKDSENTKKILFGNENTKNSDDTQKATKGYLCFEDAWVYPKNYKLHSDVLTPHHTNYISEEGKDAPKETDSPVPVPFLSVTGKFLFAISCEDKDRARAKTWEALAFNILEKALIDLGIGGKTTSGYGRMQKLFDLNS